MPAQPQRSASGFPHETPCRPALTAFFALFASLLIAGCLSAQSAGWHFIPHEFAPVSQFIQAGNTGPAARLEPPAGGALARELALHRRSRARLLRLAGASFGFLTGDERERQKAQTGLINHSLPGEAFRNVHERPSSCFSHPRISSKQALRLTSPIQEHQKKE